MDSSFTKHTFENHPLLRGTSERYLQDIGVGSPGRKGKEESPLCSHLSLKPWHVTAVVYHHPCPDGFVSALVAYFALGLQVEFFPASHNQLDDLVDQIKDHHVLFVDIAPNATLRAALTKNYAILDHHSNTEKDLVNVPEDKKWFRMDYSGCHLAWDYFYPEKIFPLLFRAIEARDIWKKDRVTDCDALLNGAHMFCEWCPFKWWYTAHDVEEETSLSDLVKLGQFLQKDKMTRVGKYVHSAAFRKKDGYRIWLMNINDAICTSDAGNQVLQVEEDEKHGSKREPDFGSSSVSRANDISMSFRYNVFKKRFECSLRSLEHGPNVGALAKKWADGGGHDHASGFTWYDTTIESFFDPDPTEVRPCKKRKHTGRDSPLCILQ